MKEPESLGEYLQLSVEDKLKLIPPVEDDCAGCPKCEQGLPCPHAMDKPEQEHAGGIAPAPVSVSASVSSPTTRPGKDTGPVTRRMTFIEAKNKLQALYPRRYQSLMYDLSTNSLGQEEATFALYLDPSMLVRGENINSWEAAFEALDRLVNGIKDPVDLTQAPE